jgi:hypothetical protein
VDAPEKGRRLRILFLVHNLGKTRHFEGVIRQLTERGHTVILAGVAKRHGLKAGGSFRDNPRVEIVACPRHRVDRWRALAPKIRLARDYTRFLTPVYANASKLTERAASYAPAGWLGLLERRRWLRQRPALLARLLALAEAVIPSERYFELFIRYYEPDLVAVTPLVDFGSYQTDYVKAAHRLGIPVTFIPFSWDNLTNRGLIRVQPDRVIVWNDIQKREAVDLHGIDPDRVVVTGAARFDEFFELTPSTTKQEFCAAVGLPPSTYLLLYGCSSPFVAPLEVKFVRRWIRKLRNSDDPDLASASILIRPHPVHAAQWDNVSFPDDPGVAIWRAPSTMNSDQGLFDSLHHSTALVGLNTSAMLEAAIVGRGVFTVATPEFAGGQEQTLHFHYLTREAGGFVEVATSFSQHRRQLLRGFSDLRKLERRSQAFVESFIRPAGRHRRADRVVALEIEKSAGIRKRRRLLRRGAL